MFTRPIIFNGQLAHLNNIEKIVKNHLKRELYCYQKPEGLINENLNNAITQSTEFYFKRNVHGQSHCIFISFEFFEHFILNVLSLLIFPVEKF